MNRLALIILKNIVIFPWAYGKLCHYATHTDKYPEEEKYAHIQYMLKKAVDSGNIDMQVYGLENIPKENGFMMFGNHQGMFDIIALAATCPRPWGAVLKQELSNIPLLKQMVECTNSFPMDRSDLRQSMEVIVNVTKEVKKGRNYMIYPEGTRSKKGNEMLEFHSGSFKSALKAKCPILPVAMIDSFKVLDQKGSKPVSVQIHYLPVISYEEYKDLNTIELAEMVRERIKAVVDANKDK